MKKLQKILTAIGFDDGFFVPRKSKKTILTGIVFRSNNQVDGVLCDNISVDGFNVTEKIISLTKNSRFKENISFIFLDGINFAGFNIVNVEEIFTRLGIPIIIVFRRKPRMEKIKTALSRLSLPKKRLSLIEKAGKVHSAEKICFQCYGITAKEAKKVIKKFSYYSNLPEPIRLAHLIASGITLGESTAQ